MLTNRKKYVNIPISDILQKEYSILEVYMFKKKMMPFVMILMMAAFIVMMPASYVFASHIGFETFINSVKAGEFKLDDSTYDKLISYIEDGDVDSAMEIYRDYFGYDDPDDTEEANEEACTEAVVQIDDADVNVDAEETIAAEASEENADSEAEESEQNAEVCENAADEESSEETAGIVNIVTVNDEIVEVIADEVVDEPESSNDVEENVVIDDSEYHGLSQSEYTALCKIVQAEAPGEGVVGKMMVANVVMNRVRNPLYPASVIGVVSQPGQFSPYRNGAYARQIPNAETIAAVNRVLNGENNAVNVYSFKSVRSSSRWGHKRLAFVYGNHMFYY